MPPSIFAADAVDVAFYGFWFSACLLFGGAPTWIALLRHHPAVWQIAGLNVLLGWTVVGWLVSLVWALSAFKRDPVREDDEG